MNTERDSLVLGSSDILGVVSGIDISRSEDEFELLQKLQKLIAEQTQDLSQVNQRVQEYEKDKVAVVAIETSVLDFENHITTLREQVTEELREYLDNVENAEIIAQLNDSIKQLGEGFKTQIVVNVPGAKKDNKYSELVGEIEGEMEASEVLRLVGHQLRSTLEDQAESFVAVLEDMHKLTDEELSEDLRLPIIWEPMRQDLEDIQERLARDAAESDNSKSFTELASVYQWMQDQRQLFVHQRNLLDQICHKVIQVDGDEDEEDQPEGELEGELEGEEEGEYEEPNMTRGSAEGEGEEEEEEEGVIVEDDEEDEELQDDEDEEDDDYSESYNPEEELDYGSSGED